MGPRLESTARFFAAWLGGIHSGECPARQCAAPRELHRLFCFFTRRLRRTSPARHWKIHLGQLYSVAREVARRGIGGCFPRSGRRSSESRFLPPPSGNGGNSGGARTETQSPNGGRVVAHVYD